MAIVFECPECGKSFTVGDDLAGKTGRCKQCGHLMIIPAESDSDGYGLDDLARVEAEAEPAPASLPPRMAPSRPEPVRRPLFDPPGAASEPRRSGFGGFEWNGLGGIAGVLVVAAGLIFRFYSRVERIKARAEARDEPAAAAEPDIPIQPGPIARPASASAPSWTMPSFPEPSPPRQIEPGVTVREIHLGPYRPGTPPGWSGKLWLYLPSGDHDPRSLPCILIAGAGSNLLTGMALAEGDVVEHLPYVRAGFAVVAFELDGMMANRQNPGPGEMAQSMGRFLEARAGLVNAAVAFEYASTRVPAIDPGRISVAGHSSAGTLALLFAENEPRLRSCVAYAPVPDVEEHFRKNFGEPVLAGLKSQGAEALLTTYSPRTHESGIGCPLFLFYARDDQAVPEITAFASRLKAARKPITVVTVPRGGHYDPMIQAGIPAAIPWLRKRDQPRPSR